MGLSRIWKRRNWVKPTMCFCSLCCRILDEDEDLNLHFAIIHPGVDKEGPLDEGERKNLDAYSGWLETNQG